MVTGPIDPKWLAAHGDLPEVGGETIMIPPRVPLLLVCTLALLLNASHSGFAASPIGDVVGKVSVGYQGWFASPGRWFADQYLVALEYRCPDTDHVEHQHRMLARYAPILPWFSKRDSPNLSNGQPAMLFSSYDQQVVDTHFRWMEENEIDTAALQRFSPFRRRRSYPKRNDPQGCEARAETYHSQVLHHVRHQRLGRLYEPDQDGTGPIT